MKYLEFFGAYAKLLVEKESAAAWVSTILMTELIALSGEKAFKYALNSSCAYVVARLFLPVGHCLSGAALLRKLNASEGSTYGAARPAQVSRNEKGNSLHLS